jgi:hypothetical protein
MTPAQHRQDSLTGLVSLRSDPLAGLVFSLQRFEQYFQAINTFRRGLWMRVSGLSRQLKAIFDTVRNVHGAAADLIVDPYDILTKN